MKRTIVLSSALCFALALSSGCAHKADSVDVDKNTQPSASEVAKPQDVSEESGEPEIDNAPMNVDDPNSPEGAVNTFFNSFFTGDNEGAFAMLTERAQASRRDQFSAQASSTVRWRITRKMKPFQGRVYVLTEVEDYTDAGELQSDELTFVLVNDKGSWRIAGFSVGDLAINFEDRLLESVAQDYSGDVEKKALKTARRVETNLMR